MAVHSGRLLTAAIETTLTDAGLTVGVGEKPSTGGWSGAEGASTFAPYTVVYPTPGGIYNGTVAIPHDDPTVDFVISSFGSTVAQALWGDDQVRAAITAAGAITVAGRSVLLVIPDVDGGVIRDDDVDPPVYHSPTRYRVVTTAA